MIINDARENWIGLNLNWEEQRIRRRKPEKMSTN